MNKPPKPVSLAPVKSFSAVDAPQAASPKIAAPTPMPSVVKIHQPLQQDAQDQVRKSLDLSDGKNDGKNGGKSSAHAASAVPEPKASAPAMSADKVTAPSLQSGSTVSKVPVAVAAPVAVPVAKPATTIVPPVTVKASPAAEIAPVAANSPTPAAKPERQKPVARAAAKSVAKAKAASPRQMPVPAVAPVAAMPAAKPASAAKAKAEIKVKAKIKAAPKTTAFKNAAATPKVAVSPAPAPVMPAMFDMRSFAPSIDAASLMPAAFNGDIVKTMTSQMLNVTRAFGDMQAALLDHAVTELKTGMGEIEACARSTTPSEVVVIQARAVRRSTEALTETLKTISDKARKTLMPR